MHFLVLGGTVFVGRHFVEAAMARGHRVTLMHRGQRGADLFPEADRILADRDGGMDAIGDRSFDAVVDCCGYVPRVVGQSAEALRGRCGRYLFVSTISVYTEPIAPGADENAPLAGLADPTTEEVTGETYGGLKVLCEQEVTSRYGDRALIIRPGLIAGPYDPTNRFTYWVDRIDQGGKVLAPAIPNAAATVIDARDLGLFMVLALERGLSGSYNLTGDPTRFHDMLETLHKLCMDAEFVWATPEALEQAGVALWQELPLAIPGDDGLMRVSNAKAKSEGLALRPLIDTARDTLAWRRSLSDDTPARHGLSREKEAEALATIL